MFPRLLLLFVLIVTGHAGAQSFQKTFGGQFDDVAQSISPVSGGGFIISGYSESFSGGSFDGYLIKINAAGDTIWTLTTGALGIDRLYAATQTTDGGFIATGYLQAAGGMHDVLLIKADMSGNVTWKETFGGSYHDEGKDVVQSADGGYVITGYTQSTSGGQLDVFLLKTNSIGNLTWGKSFNVPGEQEGYDVDPSSDGGFIIAGHSKASVNAQKDVFMIKTNSSGNGEWSKTYGTPFHEEGFAVEQTNDGGFVVAGSTTTSSGNKNTFLVKTNNTGVLAWSFAYGGTGVEEGRSLRECTDGGFIMSGYTTSFGNMHDLYLVKTNAAGSHEWSKAYGGSNQDQGYDVVQSATGYVAVGSTGSSGAGNFDLYVLKTDGNGNTGCNESQAGTIITAVACVTSNMTVSAAAFMPVVATPLLTYGHGGNSATVCTFTGTTEYQSEYDELIIFPNPANRKFTVTLTGAIKQAQLKIYNVSGQTIFHLFSDMNTFMVDVSGLPPGMYFVEVSNKTGNLFSRIAVY